MPSHSACEMDTSAPSITVIGSVWEQLMRATVWIVLAAAVLWAVAAGATNGVTLGTGGNMITGPLEPAAGVQLAAEWQRPSETSADRRRMKQSDQDLDVDELPSTSSRNLMPGQKAGSKATSSSSGYDAKHLNRLWGRFSGAKQSAKGQKAHVSKGGDVGSRPTRWGR